MSAARIHLCGGRRRQTAQPRGTAGRAARQTAAPASAPPPPPPPRTQLGGAVGGDAGGGARGGRRHAQRLCGGDGGAAGARTARLLLPAVRPGQPQAGCAPLPGRAGERERESRWRPSPRRLSRLLCFPCGPLPTQDHLRHRKKKKKKATRPSLPLPHTTPQARTTTSAAGPAPRTSATRAASCCVGAARAAATLGPAAASSTPATEGSRHLTLHTPRLPRVNPSLSVAPQPERQPWSQARGRTANQACTGVAAALRAGGRRAAAGAPRGTRGCWPQT